MIDQSQSFATKLKFLFTAVLIGVVVGLLLTFYRYFVPVLGGYFQEFYAFCRVKPFRLFLMFLLLLGIGLLVGNITAWEPRIGGSGIPQVAAQLHGKMHLRWQRIFPAKFVGGFFTLASGLTVGREGPSVQMGAALAQGLSETVHAPKEDRPFLLVGGAAAGLATAFHAPLSGILFALEELHKNFLPKAFIAAAVASLCAGVTSSLLLGHTPILNFGILADIPLSAYPLLVGLGIVIGCCAIFFTRGIACGKKFYKAFPLPLSLRVTLAFLGTGLFLYYAPDLFGSGEHFLFPLMADDLSVSDTMGILLLKFVLLLLAFCSGLPGGIFFPLLILGALLGSLYAQCAVFLGLLPQSLLPVFAVFGMCANFAAIVRSPLTGMALILEMTGSFTYLLPLAIVAFLAYLTAELVHLPPVYEMLLEMQLAEGATDKH